MQRKNFISKNEGFICLVCGESNPAAPRTCRNHCRNCLASLHVDMEIPGDRLSKCKGVMRPIDIDYNSGKGYVLVHQCDKCKIIRKNMLAPDDNSHEFLKLSLCTKKFRKSWKTVFQKEAK